jgi:hypothetical protein
MSVEELSQYQDAFQGIPGSTDLHNCSSANDIVANLAILGFGYYCLHGKGWRKFLMPHGIAEARAALQETDPKMAIALLAWLIPIKQPQEPSNGTYGLCEHTQREAAWILGNIGTSNEVAIKALEWLTQNAQDETICWVAAENLGKIHPNNQTAREVLKTLIQKAKYEHIRQIAAWSMGKIDPGNKLAVEKLARIIQNPLEQGNPETAVERLREIDPNNPDVIDTLVSRLQLAKDERTRLEAASRLGKFNPGNQIAIEVLENLAKNTSVRLEAAERLAEINSCNKVANEVFEELIPTIQYGFSLYSVATRLGKNKPSSRIAINALESTIAKTQDEHSWGFVDKGFDKDYVCVLAADSLGEIDPGNKFAFRTMVKLLQTHPFDPRQLPIAEALIKIIRDEQYSEAVTSLKDYLSKPISGGGDYRRFLDCYKVIWHCAQNLSYPDFYQAWHQTTI